MDGRKPYWEKIFKTGLLHAIMVAFFLFEMNLTIFVPLNPAIYRIGNEPNILRPRCKKKDESHCTLPPPLPTIHFNFYCKISQITLD